MAANQVDFKILPSDQFSVYSPQTRSDKVITYFTLLSKLRGDILSVGQEDDPNNIVSAFYINTGNVQTLHLVKADGSEVTASNSFAGTVTSVDMSVPTGFSISGNPITTSGTLAVGFASGYSLPTNAIQATWTTAYNRSLTSAAVTGTSTKTLTLNQQNGGTITASWSDIDTGLTSVGLTMPAAFSVANSPLTANGTLAVTAAGLSSQYIRGDGQLANFPTPGGGGSSVNYYLNGSVSQGTFGGVTYYELSKTPIAGAGTNFTRTSASGDGYVASFITDANDPDQINIPGGNWNLEFYFNSSSSGGHPAFYGELYKVSVSNVFTLIASGSANPESITGGTTVYQYYTSIAVPQTALLATDRLAIRVYVIVDGRNVTLHTENSNFSEVITTFSTGLNSLNGLSDQVQYFAVGTSGTDFAISSSLDTHTFNLPTASATNRGALSSADWTTFNSKEPALTKGNLTEATSAVLTITGGTGAVIGTGTTIQVAQSGVSTSGFLSSTDWNTFNGKQNAITLTTTGSTGAATLIGATLNIPNYADQFVGTVTSVNMSVPTGFAISGNPITTSGTLAVAFASGYSLPTNASQTTWNTAYNDSITAFAYNTSTAVLTLTQQDAGTLTATVTLQPFTTSNLTEGTNLYYTDTRARLALSAGTGITYDSATGVITNSAPSSGGTVTSVAALTIGTTGADLSSTVVNGTTTPVITLQVPTASAANRGALSSTDWTTFNSKQGAITLTTTGSSGAATFISNTLNIPDYGSALSAYLPLAGGTLTGALGGTSAIFSSSVTATDFIFGTNLFAARRYVSTIGSISNAGYTNVCNVTGNGLASAVRMTFQGTTGSVVVNTQADILVNHYQDIYIKSESGIYTILTIRVISDNNENYTVQATTDSPNAVTLNIEVFPLNSETVVFSATALSGSTLTHICYPGMAISATGGVSGNFRTSGDGTFDSLAGTGTRMVVASSTGLLSTQAITVGTVTSIDLTAGTGITVSGGPITTSGSITVTNNDRGSSQNIFKNIAVAGQSTIVADVNDDTLTVVAGSGVTITTNDTTDTITISATGSGGTITGSGTTNYVSKFTSASAIGDSSIFDNGSVGIGTASPAYKLDVDSGSGQIAARFYNSSNVSTVVYIGDTGNSDFSDLILQSNSGTGEIFKNGTVYSGYGGTLSLNIYNSNGAIAFHPNNTANAMFIATNSNVGIGNTSPNGALSFADDVRTRKIVLWDGAANNDYQFYGFGVESSTMIQSIYASGDKFLWVAGTGTTTRNELMVIQGDGKVGIGTTSPGQKLQVDGNLLVNAGTSAAAYRDIMMGGIGGWATGESHGIDTVYNTAASPTTFSRIESHFDGTNGKMRFRNLFNASAPRTDILMTIQGNGNVGIGTDDPGAKLDVRGQTYINNGTSNALFIDTTVADNNTRDAIYLFEDDGAASGRQAISWWNGNQSYYKARLWTEVGGSYASTTFGIDVADNSRTVATRLVINNGNVGIGNTAPSQILHVSGNIRVTGAYYDSANAAGTSGQILSSTATGTSWIAAPSGSVTGSGTTNYVSKFTGTSAIGNSQIFDDGTSVGIGTALPGTKLDVAGNGRFSNGASGTLIVKHNYFFNQPNWGIKIDGDTSTSGGYLSQYVNIGGFELAQGGTYYGAGNYRTDANSTSFSAVSGYDGIITFSTNGSLTANSSFTASERMRITVAGNVGIGTTSPTNKLHIDSTDDNAYALRVQGNTNNALGVWTGIGIAGEGSNTKTAIIFEDIGVSYSRGKMHFALNNAADQTNATPANAVMTLTPDGNVGIGTTSPSTKLQVSGSTSFYNGAAATGAIDSGQSETITTGFNLGPSESLDISTISLTSNTTWKAIVSGEYANNFEGGGLTSSSLEIELDSDFPTIDVGSTDITFSRNSVTGKLQVTNTNGTYRVTFVGSVRVFNYAQSGKPNVSKIMLKNVGIGTTAPTWKLQAESSSSTVAMFRSSDSNTIVGIDNSAADGDPQLKFYINDIGTFTLGVDDSDSDKFKIGTSDLTTNTRLTIDGSGNVGIGTTSPAQKLDVEGSVRATGGGFEPSTSAWINAAFTTKINGSPYGGGLALIDGTTGWAQYTIGSGANLVFAYGATSGATSEKMRITSGGNVGIGTTAPSTQLHISGTTTNITITDTTYGRTSNIGYIDSANLYLANDASSNTYIGRYNGVFLAYGGGSVGINTTSPSYKLDVNGNVRSNGGLYSEGAHGNTFIQNLLPAAANGSGTGVVQLRMWCSEPGITWDWAGFGYNVLNDGAGPYGFGRQNASFGQSYMRFSTDGSMFFYNTTTANVRTNTMVLTAGGNVGIGTTAPGSKLNVVDGFIRVQGTETDQFFLEGLRTGTSTTVRIYDNSSTVFYDSYSNMIFRANQLGGSGGYVGLFGGNVGINTASPTHRLEVTGDVRINTGALGVNIAPSATDGRIDASNDIVAFSSSDLRLKENIKPIENALDKVKSLTGVEFDWKPELKYAHGYEGHDTGVIAQEVQEVMPTAIRTNDTGYLAVRYEKLIGLLIEANKELAARVEELESKFK